MSTARFERSRAYLRSLALFEVKAPSTVRGSSQSRGATISTKRPSPSSIDLTAATPFRVLGQSRSAGTMSSSWNWTASNPSFLYALIFRENSISLRAGGPNGSAPVLMFQGPNEKRYLVGETPWAMLG